MADFSGASAQVASTVGVEASAVVLINSFQSRLDSAIAAAVAANDDADLTELNALSADLKASSDSLAAAVASNP